MRNRSVIELLVLGLALIVGLTIIGLGALIVVVEVNNPESDTTGLAFALTGLVSAILGSLLGLLAGRSESTADLHRRPGGSDNGIP